MAIQTPTLDSIINSFIESLRVTLPDMSTTPVSVTREALINPASAQIAAIFDAAQRISTLQNIFEATDIDLDNLATSYGLTRRTGTAATGIIYVDLTQLNSRPSIEVRAGTIIGTAGGGDASFATVGDYNFTATNRSSYEATAASIRAQLDSLGLQSVTMAAAIPIIATSTGSSTNVGAYTLNTIASGSIRTVVNVTSTSGGTDDEDDGTLRGRIVAIFTGNSVGTSASLLTAALSVPGVTSGFIVLPGDSLMTRDGTIRDSDGTLIQAGTGRSTDIYIQGTVLNSNTDRLVFVQNDGQNILSVNNTVRLGRSNGSTFGFLPIFAMTSVVGQESGATFTQGVATLDDEGNILIEGSYALIKDIDADSYMIVENLVTRERKLATYLNPTSTRYSIVDRFAPSDYANSALSEDSIVFLKSVVPIEDEVLTRGEFNGADQLRFANVTSIQSVYEDLNITDVIQVSIFEEIPGGIAIQLNHAPIREIVEIRNTRLGIAYTADIVDADRGTIALTGRVPPRAGDYLTVQYIWRKKYKQGLNFAPAGDLIDWVGFADEQGTKDPSLLASTDIQAENALVAQPNIPTHLSVSVSGLSDRQIVQTTIAGSVVSFPENELALKASEPFQFATTGLTTIGRIFKVSNITKGFDYNLAGYKLQSNRFDPTINVNASLLPQQFSLSARANEDLLEPGDKIVLSRPSRTLALSTQADFTNNINNNLAPLYDATLLDFTPGGVILKTPLLDTSSGVTTLSGLVTQDIVLSGIVEITDDLVIGEGVVVDIQPSTLVKIRPSDDLDQQASFVQKILFDPSLTQDQTLGIPSLPYSEYIYLYFKPKTFLSSFFTIINDAGEALSIRFGRDLIVKTTESGSTVFYANGVRVPESFNAELESTLDLSDINSSLKATLLGARHGVGGQVEFVASYINLTSNPEFSYTKPSFYVPLDKAPVVTSNLLSDFSLAVEADTTITFNRFTYDNQINALVIEGDILTLDGYGILGTREILSVSNNYTTLELDSVTNIEPGFTIKQLQILDPADPTNTRRYIFSKVASVNPATNVITLAFSAEFFAQGDPRYNACTAIDSTSSSETNYVVTYFIAEKRRLSIIVEGTLRILGATPQTSVLFTSGAGDRSKAGDWEGIVFTPKSHTNNAATVFQSNLNNARIRFANTGVNVRASDVNIQNCIIRECLDTGISVSSSLQSRAFFSNGFTLRFSSFSSATRVGFQPSDDLRLARFPIGENMVTSLGELPSLIQKLTNTSYVVGFREGEDYKVYVDFQRVTAVDTTLPPDNIVDHALVPGVDFVVEYDIATGYSLVFLYTEGSPRLRRVRNLVQDLTIGNRPSSITLDFFASVRNGVVYDNLIFDTAVGLSLSSLATLSVNRNTIHNNRVGINADNTIASIRNNLITGFELAGLVSDGASLLQVQRNDIYSSIVVQEDQTSVADTDTLLRRIEPLAITLFVRSPSKFKVGSVIKINSEEMLVQGINPDSIVVTRGYNNTALDIHESGSTINLFQLNQIFTVTGISGNVCELIETDSLGQALPTSIPIQMRQISRGTFRATFPVNRRADYYYKYRYSTRGSSIVKETLFKVYLRNQPGVGVNDIVSLFHELPLSAVSFTPNMENYSLDPLYNNAPAADFSFSPLVSLASRQNPTYGSLAQPNPAHRYIGFLEVRINRTLNVSATRIPVFSEPLVVSSLTEEVSIVGIDTSNAGALLIPSSFSTAVTDEEADLGATGVFILDTPITLAQSGQFQVQYRRPVDLGTTLPPYYIEGSISYIFDVGSQVTFNTLLFSKDTVGGQIEFTFQVADSISALASDPASIATSASPTNIGDLGTSIGQVLQANIRMRGNDSSYSPALVYQFPILQDFSLSFTPAKDQREYKVLSIIRDTVQDTSNILIDAPISTDTFNIVGSDPMIEIFARKKIDNFDTDKEFLIALADGVTTGDTFVVARGDLVTKKPDASQSDIIRVDYMAVNTGEETLYFVSDSEQITKAIYSQVDSIVNTIIRDQAIVLPSIEQIAVASTNQPATGNSYFVTYNFQAPLEGESLIIDYTYNDLIRNASEATEARKSLFTDVQVRQVRTIPVRIAVSLEVTPEASALAVQTAVSNTISQLFGSFSDISATRRLDPSDIVRATGGIIGIEDITVTTLSKNLITGEVETLIFERRESPVLEAGSPRLNTSQNGRAIVRNT